MNLGPFSIVNLEKSGNISSLTSMLYNIDDRRCDIEIEALGGDYAFLGVPYFSFVEMLLTLLISAGSRREGVWLPLQVPEHPTHLELGIFSNCAKCRVVNEGKEFFEGEFSQLFFSVARAFRNEAVRLEKATPGLEVGLQLMFSDKTGW